MNCPKNGPCANCQALVFAQHRPGKSQAPGHGDGNEQPRTGAKTSSHGKDCEVARPGFNAARICIDAGAVFPGVAKANSVPRGREKFFPPIIPMTLSAIVPVLLLESGG
jgi:hypothetical protein